MWSSCITDRVLLFFAFSLFVTSKSHYSDRCAELFVSRVGTMTTKHITGMHKPELWSLETIVLFWLPASSCSLETALAKPWFREWFSFQTVTAEELICSLKRRNSPEITSLFITEIGVLLCLSVVLLSVLSYCTLVYRWTWYFGERAQKDSMNKNVSNVWLAVWIPTSRSVGQFSTASAWLGRQTFQQGLLQ